MASCERLCAPCALFALSVPTADGSWPMWRDGEMRLRCDPTRWQPQHGLHSIAGWDGPDRGIGCNALCSIARHTPNEMRCDAMPCNPVHIHLCVCVRVHADACSPQLVLSAYKNNKRDTSDSTCQLLVPQTDTHKHTHGQVDWTEVRCARWGGLMRSSLIVWRRHRLESCWWRAKESCVCVCVCAIGQQQQ